MTEAQRLRELLEKMLAAQIVQPYRGWSITDLNKAADEAREHLCLTSIRNLNPDIAKMQDAAASWFDKTALVEEVPGLPVNERFFIRYQRQTVWHGPSIEAGKKWAEENNIVIDKIERFEP